MRITVNDVQAAIDKLGCKLIGGYFGNEKVCCPQTALYLAAGGTGAGYSCLGVAVVHWIMGQQLWGWVQIRGR